MEEPDTPFFEKKCKSDEQILNWVTLKYIVSLENETSFSRDTVTEEVVKKTSSLNWTPISPQIR